VVDQGDLLTLPEVAAILRVHYLTVYRRVRSGEIPAHKIGGAYRVRRRDLDEWLERPSASFPRRGAGRSWPSHRGRLLEALVAGDAPAARRLVRNLVQQGATMVDVEVELLAPALAEIGDRWEAGTLSVAAEHRAASLVEQVIGEFSGQSRRPGPRRGTAVVASVPGEEHRIPGLMAADALREASYDVHHLGTGVPVDDLFAICAGLGSPLVVLTYTLRSNGRRTAATASALRSLGLTALVGAPGASLHDLRATLRE
jgi:excisionase family DNA binding protein